MSLGEMPERPKGADCKSAGECLRRFESYSHHQSSLLRSFVWLRRIAWRKPDVGESENGQATPGYASYFNGLLKKLK